MASTRLGEILIEAGVIQRVQWEHAQHLEHRGEGSALLWIAAQEDRGEAMLVALASAGVETIAAAQLRGLPPSVIGILPGAIAAHHLVLPLALRRDHLVLAMADPFSERSLEALSKLIDATLELRFADPNQLSKAIDFYYGTKLRSAESPAASLPLPPTPPPSEDPIPLSLRRSRQEEDRIDLLEPASGELSALFSEPSPLPLSLRPRSRPQEPAPSDLAPVALVATAVPIVVSQGQARPPATRAPPPPPLWKAAGVPLPAPPAPPATELHSAIQTTGPIETAEHQLAQGEKTDSPSSVDRTIAKIDLQHPSPATSRSPASTPVPVKDAPATRLEPAVDLDHPDLKEDFDFAITRLRIAESRDEIGEAAILFLARCFPRAALFSVRGNELSGWLGGGELSSDQLDLIHLEHTQPSLLWTAVNQERPFIGAIGPERECLREVMVTPPREAAAFPVRIGGKTAAILYGDSPDNRPLLVRRDLLERLADELGDALGKFILESRKS